MAIGIGGLTGPEAEAFKLLTNLLKNRGALLLLIVTAVLVWLGSGFFIVSPGQQGIIRQFGKEIRIASAGLNWRIPWPVERVNIVNVEQVRRLEVGFGRQVPEENIYMRQATTRSDAMMLTGDENIVEAQIIVQYKVKDPVNYLFRLYDPEGTLYTV